MTNSLSPRGSTALCSTPQSQPQAHSLLLSEGDTGTYWRPVYIQAEVTGRKARILACDKRADFEEGWTVLLQGQP